ncbi:MAG: ribose-5-phosphate isomerase RpiA [Gemmataceae bacterium]
MTNVERALALVQPNSVIGLGSGKAAERFIRALGERVRQGFVVAGVATSAGTERLALEVGVPLLDFNTAMDMGMLAMTVDGADEVDPQLNMIKGFGRALVREKIVATASQELVILIGPEKVTEKQVQQLGRRGTVPIEVVPFAVPLVRRVLADMNLPTELLMDAERPFVTDNLNHILHAKVNAIPNPAELESLLLGIPGVVGTGLFIQMAHRVFVQEGETCHERVRSSR